jgi:hypothetical protein
MKKWVLLFCFIIAFFSIGKSFSETKKPQGLYFSEKPPSKFPKVFAPGIISVKGRDDESCTFSPKGDECFIVIKDTIYYTYMKPSGEWNKFVAPPALNKGKVNCSPVFSADAKTVFFISSRNRPDAGFDLDIWCINKNHPGDWGRARRLPRPVFSSVCEVSPSLTKNGTLYYASYFNPLNPKKGGSNPDMFDLYRSVPQYGRYQKIESLGPIINNEHYQIGCAINPDESCLVYGQGTTWPEEGQRDLFVTFRQNDSWTKPIKLGPEINSKESEGAAFFSWDGKYFFFGSKKSGDSQMYWVDVKYFDKYRSNK